MNNNQGLLISLSGARIDIGKTEHSPEKKKCQKTRPSTIPGNSKKTCLRRKPHVEIG